MAMEEFKGASSITDDVVRDRLVDLVEHNTCWGDAPAKDMKLEEISPVPALHYVLESFSESRVTQVWIWFEQLSSLGSYHCTNKNEIQGEEGVK